MLDAYHEDGCHPFALLRSTQGRLPVKQVQRLL
jgi:hypothetical protein